MKTPQFSIAIALAAGIALGGCTPEPDAQEGRALYMTYCAACHGQDARGNGPISGELPVPPADLTVLSVDNGGVFPSARVMEKINGYPERYQSDIMPEFGTMLSGPKVIWTDDTGTEIETPRNLLALRDYLASLQNP